MKNTNSIVDEMYTFLGIDNAKKVPRNEINKGSLNKQLNTDFSATAGEKKDSAWSINTMPVK